MELKLLKSFFDLAVCIFEKYKDFAIEVFNDLIFIISLFVNFSITELNNKIEIFVKDNKEKENIKAKSEEGFLIVQLSYILMFFGLKTSDLHYLFLSKEYDSSLSEKFLKVFSSEIFKDTIFRIKNFSGTSSKILVSEELNFTIEKVNLINRLSQKIDLYEFKDRDLLFLFHHA